MAFSFTDLLKKQFPLAGVEAYTGSPKRMPKELDELSPFLSTSALGMGGALNVLDGVSMADYFNNDNYEMRPTEASPKRGEDVLRPYRMSPGDKKTIKVNNNGKIVETTERTTGDLFSEQPNMSSPPTTSAQSYALGEGPVGDSNAIFRNEQVGMMPIDSIPPARSMYNRPDEYDRMARGNHGMGGPLSSIASNNPYTGTPYIPIDPMSGRPFNNVDSMGSQGYIPNNVDLLGGQGSVGNLNNTVYPRPTTRSMYNRPVNSPNFMGGQGSVGDTGYRGTYGVPMYGQPRPTLAQTSSIINGLLEPELGDTAQSEMNRMPTLVAQGEDGAFPPLGSNVYGPDEGLLDEDPDDERRRLLGELLRQYYQKNPRIYTLSI